MKNLILIRGVSGSGKSTVAALFNTNNLASTDDFFIDEYGDYVFNANSLVVNHQKCQLAVKMMMQDGFGEINFIELFQHFNKMCLDR